MTNHRTESRNAARARAALPAAALLAALALTACSGSDLILGPAQPVVCAQRRLELAQGLYGEARTQMLRYYKERSVMGLQFVYYLSGDAMQVARQTRNCPDFTDSVRNQALTVIRSSRLMRTLAISNMRDPDPAVAAGLLQERYADLFVNKDIE
jgi:hypothetical protein